MNLQDHLNAMRRPAGNTPTMADRFPDATPESARQEIDALRGDRVMFLSLRDIDDQPATSSTAGRVLTMSEIESLQQNKRETTERLMALMGSTVRIV